MTITVEGHLAEILARVGPLPVEEVPVAESLGLCLAADLAAVLPVPPFDNSAMDGFATHAADASAGAVLDVVGDLPAGAAPGRPLPPGAAIRIMTGAPLPPGADCVVKVEDTDQPVGAAPLPARVRLTHVGNLGDNIRRRGEDVAAGEVVLPAGTRLTPAAIASAISIGYDRVPVHRRPRVAVISTGSELVEPGRVPGPGQIPDSNSALLAALVAQSGCVLAGLHRVADDAAALAAVLAQAAAEADLVISSGGVSAGAFDVVKELTAASGFTFTQVAMQPGKPQGHGILQAGGCRTPMLTLPGNPVSVFVSFQLFARPVLARMGAALAETLTITASAGSGWKSPPGRRQFVPVHLERGPAGDHPVATPTHRLGSGSHLVASLHRADALAVVPEAATTVATGELVDVMVVG